MTQSLFFDQISKHFSQNLPFVVFRKPNANEVNAWFQKDTQLIVTTQFTETGFVFSPFKNEEHTVLFPQDACDIEVYNKDIILDENDTFNTTKRALYVDENQAKQSHLNTVEKAIKAIKKGDFKKVIISRIHTESFNREHTILLLKQLLATYKTAMVYCWYHPKVGLWLGATPETLLKVDGNSLQTMSLAGTQPFKGTTEVTWQKKEIEEQQLVTNFIVNSLKNEVNHLTVGPTQTVKAGNVLHLQTKISATLNTLNFNLKDVLVNLHPTPAVCGLPKIEAKKFILNNENYNREFYTGFLGELNLKQTKSRNSNRKNVENNAYQSIKTSSHLFVNLRCLQIKDNQAMIYVGGGITKDSVPENEWEETIAKAQTIKSLL